MIFEEEFKKWSEKVLTENFEGDAGAGILAFVPRTQNFLVALRGPKVSAPNTWNGLGGRIERGESNPSEAAEREFREESGYSGAIEEIVPLKTSIYDDGFVFFNFLGILLDEFTPEPAEEFAHENSVFKWVSFDQLLSLKDKHIGLKALLSDENSMEKIQELLAND